MERALESEARYFRYVGAVAGARPFCRERVGKVYSIEEIRGMDNGQDLAVEYFCGGWNCRHRWVAVAEDGSIAKKLQEIELIYNEKDKRQDVAKHAKKFGLSPDEYIEEAKRVVKNAKQIYKHTYLGETQYNYIGENGYVVVDRFGKIRGYYYHGESNIEKMIENRKNKTTKKWRKIK